MHNIQLVETIDEFATRRSREIHETFNAGYDEGYNQAMVEIFKLLENNSAQVMYECIDEYLLERNLANKAMKNLVVDRNSGNTTNMNNTPRQNVALKRDKNIDIFSDNFNRQKRKRLQKLRTQREEYYNNTSKTGTADRIIHNRSMWKNPSVVKGYKKHHTNKDEWDTNIENRLPKR
jgi:hypothetical protein